MRKFRRDNATTLEETADRIRASVSAIVEDRAVEIATALADSACDGENRGQPQAARVLGELSGVIGSKGINLHIGDLSQHVHVELPQSALEFDPERYAERRKRLGV